MRVRTSAGLAALAIGLAAASTVAAPSAGAAVARPAARTVVTDGLDGPFGLASGPRGSFLVAESVTGQLTWVSANGSKRELVTGAPGMAGAAWHDGKAFGVIGGPNEQGAPSGGPYGPSRVLRVNPETGNVVVIANLLAYEKRHNPDGQVQYVNGQPVDALSNPFAMTDTPHGLLVADGGANDVLKVNPKTGKVTTFFVPPTVKDVEACLADGAQANPGTVGCDPVPTGVVQTGGSVWVSTLGAEVPGAGRVYELNPRSGAVRHVWKGLTAPTGIAVGPDGAVYVSEVLFNAPEGDGPPPPGFDPSQVGRITRIAADGTMTHAQVTMPTGLLMRHGRLFASTWSVAFFLGIDHAGKIERVRPEQFS